MKKSTIFIATIFSLAFFVLFDLGYFWKPIVDQELTLRRGSGGRYQHSFLRHAECAIFSPDKTYRPIGSDGWSSDVINGGYWCMSDEDIEEFRATSG